MRTIREPAVAGQFYPASARVLSSTVKELLDEAEPDEGPAPKALIVPHAGYLYSGTVAAAAYARLRPYRQQYRRVVLLGPSHRVAMTGLAFSGADVFRTPLGDVPLDKDVITGLPLPQVKTVDAAHQFEHSLEVHLPFLQSILGPFSLVPLVVGDAAAEVVAQVIDALWGGPETLFIISSDLSHYLSYNEARASDKTTCEAIESLQTRGIDHRHACGATPIGGLLIAAKRHRMQVSTLKLMNSGDSTGDKGQVVGYGSWIFLESNGS